MTQGRVILIEVIMASILYRPVCETSVDIVEVNGVECEQFRFPAKRVSDRLQEGWYSDPRDFTAQAAADDTPPPVVDVNEFVGGEAPAPVAPPQAAPQAPKKSKKSGK